MNNGDKYIEKNIGSYCSSTLAKFETSQNGGDVAQAELDNGNLCFTAKKLGNAEVKIKLTSHGETNSFEVPFNIVIENTTPVLNLENAVIEAYIDKEVSSDIIEKDASDF